MIFLSKNRITKNSSYSEEDNSNNVGARIMYPLHYSYVKLMDLNNIFSIKDATTNHIHSYGIYNDPDMEYSSFTKSHRRSMTQLVRECSHRSCKILLLVNAESLLNSFSGSLLELPTLKQQMNMFQSMVKISSEIPPFSMQRQALFAMLSQHFTINQLHKITKYPFIYN